MNPIQSVVLVLSMAFLGSACLGSFHSPSSPDCSDEDTPDLLGSHSPPGPDEVALIVTRDFGYEVLRDERIRVEGGESVMEILLQAAEVKTSYGGQFVVSIDGLGGLGGSHDWFYEVNGRFAQVGAADSTVQSGDRVHWDYRDWTGTPVPGLFNSFPWETAQVLEDGDLEEPIPEKFQGRAGEWTGTWPDGPAVLLTTPDNASWSDHSWIHHEDDTLFACDRSLEDPWALTTRTGPLGTTRVLVVIQGQEPLLPVEGVAWIAHKDDVIRIHPD